MQMGSTRDYSLEALFSLKGKTVLLTGAAGGIGAELARGLAGAGAELALCDIALERAENLAASLPGSRAYRLDVAELSSIHACVEAVLRDFSKIDILVNCAGINKREGYLDVTEETYDRIMDINLKGMYFLSQDVAKHMMQRKSGNIITSPPTIRWACWADAACTGPRKAAWRR
jgi:NAD(P)-dependent dehydrogenase (short-subunit alcohol dehydrogenase family)